MGLFLLFVVDFASMANVQDENDNPVIFDLANNSIIADSVTPLSRSVGSELFSMNSWILTSIYVLFHPSKDYARNGIIEFQ